MVSVDLGNEALKALRRSLGVGTGCAVDDAVIWSFRGVPQRAWSQPVAGAGRPTWRLRLRTAVLDNFSGRVAQLFALSDVITPPSLASLIRSADRPTRLDLASTLDVHEGSLAWGAKVLAAAARVQAAEAGWLASPGGPILATGLRPAIDLPSELLDVFSPDVEEALFRDSRPRAGDSPWTTQEIADGVDLLRATTSAPAVQTPWGITATFPLWKSSKTRSLLEVRSYAERPYLGHGLQVVLTMPARGGPVEAMQWNEVDAGPYSCGEGLGGWWAPEGGFLVHRSFYPRALHRTGLLREILLEYARRAQVANAVLAGGHSFMF